MAEDSAQDVASGVLRLRFGDEERLVPTLKIRASREWLHAAAREVPGLIEALAVDDDPAGRAAVFDFTYESGLGLICAYDVSNALSDGAVTNREWLEEHADPAELYEALRRMVRVAVPFGDDSQTLFGLLVTALPNLFRDWHRFQAWLEAEAESPAQPRSTSSPSRNGISRRRGSKTSSTRGS